VLSLINKRANPNEQGEGNLAGKVRVGSAALEERDGQKVMRGVVDAACLTDLQVGGYQRDVLSEKKIEELMEAHRNGGVDDIELGMRGARMKEEDGNVFILFDDVYIIDGLQRVTAGLRVMHDHDAPVVPHIGATIRFNTDEAIERRLFKIFNLRRTKLSPNIVLRNEREENDAVAVLFRLTNNPDFVMYKKVQWLSNRKTRELITATSYVTAVGRLHSHLGAGRGTNVLAIADGLERIMDVIGQNKFRDNVKAFFNLFDDAWGIGELELKGAVPLMANFMFTMAKVLSDHDDFWSDDRLTVSATMVQKLRRLPVKAQHIASLAGSGGPAADLLYDYIVKHLNKGTRTRQLLPRPKAPVDRSNAASRAES